MSCPSKSKSGNARLLAFVAGRLTNVEANQVASHLQSCPSCKEFVSSQETVWDLLDGWSADIVTAAPLSADFDQKLYQRIAAAPAETVWERLAYTASRWIARPALPLAVVTVLAVTGFFAGRPNSAVAPSVSLKNAVVARPQTDAVDGEQLNKALDDLQLLHQLDPGKDEAQSASQRI